MDPMQAASSLPHIVQVFQPSVSSTKIENAQIIQISHAALPNTHPTKITSYHQTVTSQSLTLPTQNVDHQRIQGPIVMSCEQINMHNMQPVTIQSQMLHSEVPSTLQFTSQMILPHVPVFKQHVLVESQQEYGPYEATVKDQNDMDATKTECKLIILNQNGAEDSPQMKRKRSFVANPSAWASNVRKLKHQSGEAYISRRGKYVPERQIKNFKNCLTSCKFKCNKKIIDTDRELIFKAFYSLTTNEKKHFIINTTERHDVKHSKNAEGGKRQFTYKYFFLVRGTRHTVCKDFYLGTLAISAKPVYNVHASKSEMNIPKPDGRGTSASSSHSLPNEVKDTVREHIMSFKTTDSTPISQFSRKKQHLAQPLTIKQMYMMYATECNSKNVYAVRQSMYRKILKQEFNIHFPRPKSSMLCAKCKDPVKKK